jgi:hypothetical protein
MICRIRKQRMRSTRGTIIISGRQQFHLTAIGFCRGSRSRETK